MARVIIYTESPAAGRALVEAVRSGNGNDVQVRLAAVGDPIPASFSERDVVLVSRGLPRREVLRILGRSWNSPRSPRLIFLEADGDHDGSSPLELEPACAHRVLDQVDRAAEGRPSSGRVAVRFRPRRGRVAARALGAEPIDEATVRAIVA